MEQNFGMAASSSDDDDRSYDMVDWKEFGYTDSDKSGFCSSGSCSDKEHSSSDESEPLENKETVSSDSDRSEELDMIELQFEKEEEEEVDEMFKFPSDVFEFPKHIKNRLDMELKDVVKDHALPFLPAKALSRFKSVSKEWERWISSPLLAHKQSYLFKDVSGFFCAPSNGATPTFLSLDSPAYGLPSRRASSLIGFLPEEVTILSSSNGLLLCQGQGRSGENPYYVCNPANKEWKKLPQPSYYHGAEPTVVLAFEPSELNIAAHFQVICAVTLIDMPVVYFEIYDSEKRAWRCSTTACVELGEDSFLQSGFYMKRMAYWETTAGEVLVFDLKNEVCGILPLPSARRPDGVLTQMRGELCYIQAYKPDGLLPFPLIEIEIYGGFDLSAKNTRRLNMEQVAGGAAATQFQKNYRVLPCVNDDVLVILGGGWVFSYHLRDRTVDFIGQSSNDSARFVPYVNSLVSVVPD